MHDRKSAQGQEPQHYCSHSIKGTSRWFRRVKKKMRQLLTAFHIWRKEPSAPRRKMTSPRLAWNSVRFNFTEQAQQIRRENRAIAVTKQQSSFIQQKLGWTTKLLILFSTQLHVVNLEYHSKFTRGYKYLLQTSFLTIFIPVFLKLTVQGTYCSGWQLFIENQAAVVSPSRSPRLLHNFSYEKAWDFWPEGRGPNDVLSINLVLVESFLKERSVALQK